ncbi:signal transduction histidine kinase [Desulfosalsimonas propionicica]|uniref:histidine kinase n=1 Tax=Desulfosalsimonas propionicica TaxID=332175 RepID=A0A7W0C7A8_9BACT|nr:HAMP domain-containing sensor histidine kinase [Desulfosalsimonas propionicica]MBA2880513.1 signal transduction histidine kinase [Desulfosalsimonas propionicica]
MKLKTRLLIVIFVVISGLIGVSALSGWLLYKVHELKTAETLCGKTMDGVARLKRLTDKLLITETLDNAHSRWQTAYKSLIRQIQALNLSPEVQNLLKTKSQKGMIISMNAFWQTTTRRLDRVNHNMAGLFQNPFPSRDGLIYQYFDTRDYKILRIKNQVDEASLYLGSEFESRLSELIEMVDREIDRQLTLTARNIILLTLLISVAVCLILTVFLSRLHFHLQTWHKAMQTLGSGGFPEKLPLTGDLELNRIAGAINQSSEDLAAIREELQKRISELHRAKEEAESANRAKGLFLAKMTHELKTPLNAIMGFSRLAAQSVQADVVQQKQLASINRNARHLLALIDEVLAMAKIEAGKEQLNEQIFDLHELMAEIEQMFLPRARAKGLAMIVQGTSRAPRQIRADRVKLSQILINLIQNAINFTSTGNIDVQVLCPGPETEDPAGPRMVAFSVTDTGCGIDAAALECIFKPFFQAETRHRTSQGTGLGLAITQNYISMMNGTLKVNSTPEKGTCFRCAVPLTGVAQADRPDSETGKKSRPPGLSTQGDLFVDPACQPEWGQKHEKPDSLALSMDEDEIASRLVCVPAHVVEEMEKAALCAEIDRLMTLINTVRDHDAKLAVVFSQLADTFDYDSLLHLLRCSSHPTSYCLANSHEC